MANFGASKINPNQQQKITEGEIYVELINKVSTDLQENR